jgi:thioredoxin-dependent peroxiredoxin
MSDATIKVGDMAPDFELPSDTGATVRLADFRGKRVVLYFYPKGGNNSSSDASFCK